MQSTIVHLPGSQIAEPLHEVAALISRARSLPELLLWVGQDRRLLFTARQLQLDGNLEAAFMHGDQVLAVASLPMAEVMVGITDYDPLCERVYHFDDQPGYRPDDSWFDSRNQRLNIRDSEFLNLNTCPPQTLSSLIVSYAFSSAGYAEVMSPQAGTGLPESYILINLVFLGDPQTGLGWREQIACLRESLECTAQASAWH